MRNAIKYGGYAMILTETARRVWDFQKKRERRRKIRTARDLMMGATMGTAAGAAAGVLFAPRSGEETREAIRRKTDQTLSAAKENIADKTVDLREAVRSRKDEYLEIADKCADAIREVHQEAARKQRKS
ncbi:MAG: YtxH domain-containing protein [Desulfococcaceae bacterium]